MIFLLEETACGKAVSRSLDFLQGGLFIGDTEVYSLAWLRGLIKSIR